MNPKMESQQFSTEHAEKIFSLFKSIQKIMRDTMLEKYKQYGLTVPQLGVIFALHAMPFSTLHEISECVGLSKSTVSGIVDRLVAQSIVDREIPKDNRRIVKLSLSKEFTEKNNIMDFKKRYFEDIIQCASPEDIEVIICGLDRLYSLMKAK